ncbi:MAG: UDP-N-acetylmuramate dehydrogenase [Pseudomonadota bacterium]
MTPLLRVGDLPKVAGKLIEDADMSGLTWLRVGGPADVLFLPANEDDLAGVLSALPSDIPVTIVGVGSNLLVRDGGVRGLVVRLGPGFATVAVEDMTVTAGAAALDAQVAKTAARAGIAGLEFLRGVPGTIGGALKMNAGAYGTETKDVLDHARGVNRSGAIVDVPVDEMGFSYRHSEPPDDLIFVQAIFSGQSGAVDDIEERMADIMQRREGSQPIKEKTGGSTFANPDIVDTGGKKAWQLIDLIGGRGRSVGDAQVSEQHCNFMINRGKATARDFECLIEGLRKDVLNETGIDLRWEIQRIGEAAAA